MRPAPNGASCPLSSSSAIPPSHRRRVGVPSPPRTARGGKVATTAADAQVGRQGLFVRNATGLVRELTAFDANGTFIARAIADVFGGRVRVTSKQTGGTGLSSSVAFTAAANNANATLGLNTTSITGFNAPYVFKIW